MGKAKVQKGAKQKDYKKYESLEEEERKITKKRVANYKKRGME